MTTDRPTVQLKGSTWAHSRGYTPMVATAQRFTELHPSVSIVWDQRSLQAFADFSIRALTDTYDLLVIDHPWMAEAAAHGVLAPLDDLLPADFWEDQQRHAVGPSLSSYHVNGRYWAAPIDAAHRWRRIGRTCSRSTGRNRRAPGMNCLPSLIVGVW